MLAKLTWLKFKIMNMFVEKPKSFGWSVEDMNNIRRWAQCQPHPYSNTLSLWEFLDEGDSVWTLSKAQRYIK